MKDKIIIILVTILFILLIWFYFTYADFSLKKDNSEILLNKINELELKLDSLNNQKDSIRIIVDSTHVKIITNEKYYQKIVNTILSQPMDSDILFIREYIRQFRDKNPQYNLCGTSETK